MNRNVQQEDNARLKTVIQWADTLLKDGRDRYRETPTPLFADGINMINKDHVTWGISGQGPIIISNLACQQNLMRVLVGVTNLTGNPIYKEAATAAVRYMFDHYTDCTLSSNDRSIVFEK